MRKKIAIFCGGPSSEHEVSKNSVLTICNFIDKKKYDIAICYISKDLNAKLILDPNELHEAIETKTPLIKILQNIKDEGYFAMLAGIHGEYAEDGRLQALLEFFSIPYSGTKVAGSALAMDKYRTSLIAQMLTDIKIPKSTLASTKLSFRNEKFHFPLIVKPNELGSSVGVFKAKNQNDLTYSFKFLKNKLKLDEILVQESVENAIELSCGCLQKKNGDFIKLPPIEIRPKKGVLFDYASKYEVGGSDEITPPVSVSKKLSEKISSITIELHKILGLRTYSRSDFLVKNGYIYFLETNTLPGMTATSLLPQEAEAIGISYTKLLDFIIENS